MTSTVMTSLQDLLVEQLADLYDAENQLTKALPKMAEAASTPELQKAFKEHLKQTKEHGERLDQVFKDLGVPAKKQHCKAMEGLIKEGAEAIEARGTGPLKDLALIAAAQRVEHYEIAGYGNVRAFAEHLGYDTVTDLLNQTLDEEGAADQKLTKIAEGSILKEGLLDKTTRA